MSVSPWGTTAPRTPVPPVLLQAVVAVSAAGVGVLAALDPLPAAGRAALAGVVVLALGLAVVRRVAGLLARERAELVATRARHEAELAAVTELALHDALTGLPNRVLLMDRLRHALGAADRRPGSVGVLFLDLDGFKAVNDDLGHATGDAVLSAVAGRLRSGVRAGDTPARLSGDEFVVVCEGVDGPAALAGAARRLEAVLSAPVVVDGRSISLGVSVGAVLHEPEPDLVPSHAAARLLARADAHMYEVKKARQQRTAEMGVLNRRAAETALQLVA